MYDIVIYFINSEFFLEINLFLNFILSSVLYCIVRFIICNAIPIQNV